MDYKRLDSGLLVPQNDIKVGGIFSGQLLKSGEVVEEFEDRNLVTNEGLNHILNTVLNNGTQVGTWYLGLFEGNYTPVATVTAATVVAAATECTAYASSTRPEYVEAASNAQSTTNSANRASFVFNASKTIYGAFLVSTSTKSATTGVLLAIARFASAKAVESTDELLLTYTFGIANAS